MNDIEILRAIQKQKPFIVWLDDKPYNKSEAIEHLIQENKKLKEKFDVIQRKIYRLEEDNIELLKPRGKDQLNYKYIECPKVEAEWYKSESYIKDNYIPKSKVKEKIDQVNKEYFEVLPKQISLMEQTILGHQRYAMENVLQELLEEGE